MKTRFAYVLLFSVPALLAAFIVAVLLFGATAGVLWIFVFGDDPWPAAVGHVLPAIFVLVCAALWAAFMSVAYLTGKGREGQSAPGARHVLVSVAVTALLVLLAVLHQWSVGNIGTQSDGTLCSRYCLSKGYTASSMPPRNSGMALCSCLDGQGREAVTLPIESVASEIGK
jgi:hypothetical protein